MNVPLEADMHAQASRLRVIAADHSAALAGVSHAPAVSSAAANTRAVFADTRHAVSTARQTVARGWGLAHLRSRVHAETLRTAATQVVRGERPALESLPPLTIAAPLTPSGAPARSRGRSA